MSAYIVNKAHIDAMVTAAVSDDNDGLTYWHEGKRHDASVYTADALGQMLVDANVASVTYRYPRTDPMDLPGPTDNYYLRPYHFQRLNRSPLEVLKATLGYEYQSCEPDSWETSEALAFCNALLRKMVRDLPGYDEALWDIAA